MIFNLGGPLDQTPTITYGGTGTFTDEGEGAWNIVCRSSGTFKADVDCVVDIFLCGGGGAGGSTRTKRFANGAGGGGGGYRTTKQSVSIAAGTSYTVTVGAAGGYVVEGNGGNGGQSNFKVGSTVIASANGGNGGGATWQSELGIGGTGGSNGGNGRHLGSDGSTLPTNGGAGSYAFGESAWAYPAAGRRYGGGGGGGGCRFNGGAYAGGTGGASGGADGAGTAANGNNATANMGGGGGGAGRSNVEGEADYHGGSGGSGIVIIRSAR